MANTDEEADDDPPLYENEGNYEDDENTRSPSMEEVKQAIMMLKNNKAHGCLLYTSTAVYKI